MGGWKIAVSSILGCGSEFRLFRMLPLFLNVYAITTRYWRGCSRYTNCNKARVPKKGKELIRMKNYKLEKKKNRLWTWLGGQCDTFYKIWRVRHAFLFFHFTIIYFNGVILSPVMGRNPDPGPLHALQITWTFHGFLIRLLFPQFGSFRIRHPQIMYIGIKSMKTIGNFLRQDTIIDFSLH